MLTVETIYWIPIEDKLPPVRRLVLVGGGQVTAQTATKLADNWTVGYWTGKHWHTAALCFSGYTCEARIWSPTHWAERPLGP